AAAAPQARRRAGAQPTPGAESRRGRGGRAAASETTARESPWDDSPNRRRGRSREASARRSAFRRRPRLALPGFERTLPRGRARWRRRSRSGPSRRRRRLPRRSDLAAVPGLALHELLELDVALGHLAATRI